MTDTATQETGAVDAPASMDSVLAEFTQDPTPKEDATDEVVRELVNEAEEGHAEEAPDEGEATDANEDGEADKAPEAETEEAAASDLDMNRIVTVKVDGQDVQVPLSEALKGYSREADYTKKAMALADERKTLESTVTAKYANDLKQATELFVKTDPILAEASSIDWNALAQEDPATYTQLRAAVDQRMQVIGQAQQEIQRVAQEQEQQTANERVEGMKAAEARIRESDPTLADDGPGIAWRRARHGRTSGRSQQPGHCSQGPVSRRQGPEMGCPGEGARRLAWPQGRSRAEQDASVGRFGHIQTHTPRTSLRFVTR